MLPSSPVKTDQRSTSRRETTDSRRVAARPLRPSGAVPDWGRLPRLALVLPLAALLLVLLTVAAPSDLDPTAPDRPAFDGDRALAAARQLAAAAPDRVAGSETAELATRALATDLAAAAGAAVTADRFAATAADGRERRFTNLVAVQRPPGASAETIVVVAHRDVRPPGPGLLDNATGTGALLELARGTAGADRAKTLVYASVDGGAVGQVGARRLAERFPAGLRPVAVVALDAPGAAHGALPLLIAGAGGRQADAALVAAAERLLDRAGDPAVGASGPRLRRQALDLIAPLGSPGAQAPFIERGVSAIQIGDGREAIGGDVSRRRLEAVGLAVGELLVTLDRSAPPAPPRSPALLVRGRVVQGWALRLLAVALLAAPVAAAAGLLLGSLRRRLPVRRPVLLLLRVAVPLTGALVAARLAAAAGLIPLELWQRPLWAGGEGVHLAAIPIALLGGAAGVLASRRLPPLPPPSDAAAAGIATYSVAFAAAAAAAVLALAAHPPAALLLAPLLYAWALLPRLRRAGATARLALVWVPLLLPPLVVAAALRLGPLDLLRAVGGHRPATAPAVAVAVAVAAALLQTPAAAGHDGPRARGRRRGP